MDLETALGISGAVVASPDARRDLHRLATGLVRGLRPAARGEVRCPADRRIEAFLNTHFADLVQGSVCSSPPPSRFRATGSPASFLCRPTATPTTTNT